MRIDALIIAVLYSHFYKMKQKGRNVVPWFQTVAVLAFSIVLAIALIVFLALEVKASGRYEIKLNEAPFLLTWAVTLVIAFISIKKIYFNSNKHIVFLENFDAFPKDMQKRFRLLVLTAFVLLPFVLLLVLYLFDKRH